jgi:transcriptional regulator with XRE-family HTH domain
MIGIHSKLRGIVVAWKHVTILSCTVCEKGDIGMPSDDIHPLRKARRSRGWKQQQLADFALISLSTVERAEAGKPIGLESIRRLSTCLGKSPEQLGLMKGENEASQIEATEDGKDMDANKRNSIRTIGTTVGSSLLLSQTLGTRPFSLAQRGFKLHNQEILDLCKTSLPIWYRLYFEGHHTEVRKVLSDHLLRLSSLAERPSRYQQLAGNLASQAHQLAFLLAIHQQDFCTALMHTKEAFQCGVIAEDFNLQTSALIREGYVYYLVNDPESMLYIYQKAFQNCDKVPPLLQGGTYSGLAKAHAFSQQGQEADHFLGLTHDTFPEHPEKDPTYSYTHWGSFTPANYEIVVHLQLNKPENAWDVCEKIAHTGALRTPFRVELLIRQAEASFALGKLDQCRSYVEQAAIAALDLGSDLRYQEAYAVFNLMRKKWPRERDVKELAEFFPRQERT